MASESLPCLAVGAGVLIPILAQVPPGSPAGSWGCGSRCWWSTPPTRLSSPSPFPTTCCNRSSPPASPQSLAFASSLPSAYVSTIWALLRTVSSSWSGSPFSPSFFPLLLVIYFFPSPPFIYIFIYFPLLLLFLCLVTFQFPTRLLWTNGFHI